MDLKNKKIKFKTESLKKIRHIDSSDIKSSEKNNLNEVREVSICLKKYIHVHLVALWLRLNSWLLQRALLIFIILLKIKDPVLALGIL